MRKKSKDTINPEDREEAIEEYVGVIAVRGMRLAEFILSKSWKSALREAEQLMYIVDAAERTEDVVRIMRKQSVDQLLSDIDASGIPEPGYEQCRNKTPPLSAQGGDT